MWQNLDVNSLELVKWPCELSRRWKNLQVHEIDMRPALLLIDLDLHRCQGNESQRHTSRIGSAAASLLRGCREARIPVFHISTVAGSNGTESHHASPTLAEASRPTSSVPPGEWIGCCNALSAV